MLNHISRTLPILLFFLFSSTMLHAEKISAYFDAAYSSESKVKSKLKKAGFHILASYSPAKMNHIKVIVFTNKSLKAMASKKNRGFAAIQRVMIDSDKKSLRMTNPEYWLKAFLQDDYKEGDHKTVTASLGKAFGKLTSTKDVLDGDDLSGYHFMMAMPYYKDMLNLAEGKTVRPKKKLFEVKLDNGSTLVGVKMSKAAEGFIEKIGTENAVLLPYTVLIEDGKAVALHAKYYLAISYPLLSMGQFMTISSIPDTIERSLKKALK